MKDDYYCKSCGEHKESYMECCEQCEKIKNTLSHQVGGSGV